MKKLTKLLTSLPLIGAAITPVAYISSCGKTNLEEVIDMVEFKKDTPYAPTFKPLLEEDPEAGPYNQIEATDAYINHMSNHPDDFKQDMLNYVNDFTSNYWHNTNSVLGEMKEFEFGVGTPTFGKTTIWSFGYEPDIVDTISFVEQAHFVFENNALGGDATIKTEFTLSIKYTNLVFRCYEYFAESDDELSGWTPGIIDWTLGDEAFWLHKYNSNPWSISYSCVDEMTKTIPGVEGKPGIEIKNCRYFSGLIDEGDKLFNLYEYRKKTDNPQLENDIIDIIIMKHKRPSYYFTPDENRWVKNVPDVCLTDQLTMTVKTDHKTDLEIAGVNLIPEFKQIVKPTIKFNIETEGEGLVLPESTGEDNAITIPKDAVLEILPGSKQILRITGVSLKSAYTETTGSGEYHSYTINEKMLPVIIKSGEEEIKTTLYLHYNSIKVYVVEI